jgi:hypothetical protein
MERFKVGATKAERGGLVIDSPEAYKQAVRDMPEGRYIVTIEDEERKRTNAANRYLWGPIYTTIAEYTGQSKEDIHDEMCARFTAETVSYTNPATGEMVELEVVRRTSGMKVRRFHQFVEDVKLFGQEFFGLTFEDAPAEYHQERERAEKRAERKIA